jgi:hypothetical protein
LARFVVAQEAGPTDREAEAGESDGEVGLCAPDLELQAAGVPQSAWPRRDAEHHRLAGGNDVEISSRLR